MRSRRHKEKVEIIALCYRLFDIYLWEKAKIIQNRKNLSNGDKSQGNFYRKSKYIGTSGEKGRYGLVQYSNSISSGMP